MIIELIDYLKERQRAVRVASGIAVAMMLIWTMIGVDSSHAHTWLEKNIPGFWALFTLVACLALIVLARFLGKGGIMTREDYYDD